MTTNGTSHPSRRAPATADEIEAREERHVEIKIEVHVTAEAGNTFHHEVVGAFRVGQELPETQSDHHDPQHRQRGRGTEHRGNMTHAEVWCEAKDCHAAERHEGESVVEHLLEDDVEVLLFKQTPQRLQAKSSSIATPHHLSGVQRQRVHRPAAKKSRP